MVRLITNLLIQSYLYLARTLKCYKGVTYYEQEREVPYSTRGSVRPKTHQLQATGSAECNRLGWGGRPAGAPGLSPRGGSATVHRERVGRGRGRDPGDERGAQVRAERGLLIRSGGQETAEPGNETRIISSLVKVTSKKQDTLTSEEAPILEFLLSLAPKLSCTINTQDVPPQPTQALSDSLGHLTSHHIHLGNCSLSRYLEI